MSFSDRDGVIWLDGAYVPWRDANIHLLTHSLHYGMGVFEGVRAYQAEKGVAVFRLREHTERLFRSARIFRMEIPYDLDTLMDVQKEVIRRNQLAACYIRPLVFYGSEGMGLRAPGLKVHVGIAAWTWGAYLGEAGLEAGIKVATSSFTRHHVNVSMCKAKATGHYINSMLALQEAVSHGCDEALLLDTQGFVSEGSGENFFMVRDGTLITPPLTSCLDGITRATVMILARDAGIPVVERHITRDEVYIADEAFFTGTAAEVTPIRILDDRVIGAGNRGPITTVLQKAFFDAAMGKLNKYNDWLTYI